MYIRQYTIPSALRAHLDLEVTCPSHVEVQGNNANKRLGLIHRSYTYLASESLKKLFVALVCPHLEYAVVLCYPHLKQDEQKLIGSVLRRATKSVNTYQEKTLLGEIGKTQKILLCTSNSHYIEQPTRDNCISTFK